jgi:hypothetical protein
MKAALLHEHEVLRTFTLVLDTGEKDMASLQEQVEVLSLVCDISLEHGKTKMRLWRFRLCRSHAWALCLHE